ncbi:MAG: sugar transferase [Pseudomonadota bacterium]
MLKRLFDVVASFVLLVLFAPVLVVVAAIIWYRLGRPILFVHERPGLHGRIFRMYKFRSMNAAVDSAGRLRPDAARTDAFGRWLRSSSLDELPELFNVLRGDMSLVGPRPLLTEYLPLYTPDQARRHDVRPGITGLAQVNGRNTISWEEKFALDVHYVERRSFLMDLGILAQTAKKIVFKSEVANDGDVRVEKFTGSVASQDS